ncbi:rod shape-determining protein [Candidatus Poseidoniales archaeon]|jgi:rod shape-determining protein MreB|nr:rod shape-determining protein [Candidatus Poseidoniales archaeon]MDG1549285.1 rod shape-determining protein [Candidatus Poseidoniaceae archaeon]
MAGDVLYIGIDLGTFRSVMVSSDSHEEEELTVIGTPKDPIARNFLKRDVLFGEEALKNRLALNLFRPLEHGVIKDTNEDRDFIAHFITHLISLSDPETYDRVVAVIGAPAEASYVDKTAIFDAAAGTVNAAMIISEPFAVAYALDMLEHTLVIDIGAGTTDLCRVYGTIPTPEDQMHTEYAGDYVDRKIIEEVQSKYSGAQITKDMARRWKEQHSFVSTSTPDGPIMVDFSIEGKAMTLDITDCVQKACESIVDPIVENVKILIASSNPEYQDAFRRNMILAGGGSGISGLGAMIERKLSDLGDVSVHVVDDPVRLGAMGGLRLAMEVPEEMWKNLTLASR